MSKKKKVDFNVINSRVSLYIYYSAYKTDL